METRAPESTRTDDWVEGVGRVGLGARGVVYCVVGVLAVALATGDRQEQTDQQGAVAELAERPLGEVLLAVLAAGFAAYAAWRIARAVRGEGDEEPDAGQRLLDVAKAAVYAGFAVSTVRLLTRGDEGAGGSGGQGGAQQTFTARLMTEQSWGRWAVGLAGAGIGAYGAWQIWRGLSQKFRKRLEETFSSTNEAVVKLGVIGHVARGIVFLVVAWLLVRAAVNFDPAQPVGIDAALREVVHAPYGPFLTVVVAIGLGAFGLYSFGEARYRQIS